RKQGRPEQFLGHTVPVTLRDFVLIPSSDARFRRAQKLTAFFEVYNVPTPGLRVGCRIRSEGGGVQELPERLLDTITEAERGRTSYGVSIPLLGFGPGQHSIEFEVTDPARGSIVRRSASFTIY